MALLVLAVVRATAVHAGQTTRVSIAFGGLQADGDSAGPALSADGRVVAFASDATNLVADDTNGVTDVFVHDRTTGATTRVSVGPGGVEANAASGGPTSFNTPAISGDGRYVAFQSYASNLVPGDSNGVADVYVHDRDTVVTTRVSVGPGGIQANGSSGAPYGRVAISADGRVVAFTSSASNLVAGDTNGGVDMFVRELDTGTTSRVSVRSGGGEAEKSDYQFGNPAISADGRWVAFISPASNLVPGDTNRVPDVFLHDRVTVTTTRVNVSSSGQQADQATYDWVSLSADGRLVVFSSPATNLVAGDVSGGPDIFIHDRDTGTTELVSVDSDGRQSFSNAYFPAISADGRFVAFYSTIDIGLPGDRNGSEPDVYVRDLATATTHLASTGSTGVQGDEGSYDMALSADGGVIAFRSEASNLIDGDTNDVEDIYVREWTCGNGVVEPDEQCDDGNLVADDGCEADCSPSNPVCRHGIPVQQARLQMRNGRLKFQGRVGKPLFSPLAFDGAAEGAQLRIDDLGTGGTTVFELSARTLPVPAGSVGTGCSAAGDGWSSSGNGLKQTYRNLSGAVDPPTCTAGTAQGLSLLQVRKSDGALYRYRFSARAQSASFGTPVGPLRGTLVLGASAADSLAGDCAVRAFGPGECTATGGRIDCR